MKLENSFFSKKHSIWGLAACVLFAGAVDATAQNYVHGTSATLNNAGGAILSLRGSTSQFRNFAPATTNIVNNGVFEVQQNVAGNAFADGAGTVGGATALGSTAPLRVPGTVLYSFPVTAGTQQVQGRYYNNLNLAQNSTKEYVANTVYVAGAYTATGGDRDYGTSTFIYDGVLAQTLLGENGTSGNINRYYNLNTQNAGAKTVAGPDEVRVSNVFTMEASNTATLTVNGTLRSEYQATQQAGAGTISVDGATALFNLGSSTATFSAANNVALENGGTLNTGAGTANFAGIAAVNNGLFNVGTGSGLVTIDPTGTLALANAATALLYATTGTQIDVAGTFTNGLAARTNMNFNDLSTVRYTGSGQTIVSTVLSNPYGNLIVTNASKTVAGDIHVSNNFGAYDNNLPMAANTLFMSDPTALANYGPGIEVVGRMNRIMGSVSSPLTFNNEATIVTMTSGAFPASMTFNVQPATAPFQYDNTTDVNRKITVDYPATGWTAQIRAGYKVSDIPGAWAPTTSEGTLRFYETDPTAAEKLATGQAYARNTTATAPAMRWVELGNIQATSGVVDALADGYFASGNDLLLRGGPTTFYTINDGRWSNPNTWDEGIQPSASDNAVVQHTVHVGYRRNGVDGGTTNGRLTEDGDGTTANLSFASSNITLANNTTISDIAGASLLFGSNNGSGNNDDASQNINWSFGGTFINRRAAATVNPDNALLSGTYLSATNYDGIINFATPGTSSLIFSTGLTNNGALSNGGLIRVGQ